MARLSKITVDNVDISITTINDNDYISLTDMVRGGQTQVGLRMLLRTGSGTGLPLNFWEPGKQYTIEILKWSNSTTLDEKPVCLLLP
jgi:hypothetical protein